MIAPEHIRRFRDEGFFVLESVLPPSDLDTLRGECRRFVDERDREMDELGVDTIDLDHRGQRYFVHAWGKSPGARTWKRSECPCPRPRSHLILGAAPPGVERFLLSDLMAQIAHATLGNTAYLFNEQYVVKAAERGMKFSWHQDGGFIPYEHAPYLTCWITLDDVTEENGTVYLLPYSRAGTRDVVPHLRDEETNDMVGYFGGDPGDPVVVPAGSIACFSSTLFHRSGPNTTDRVRRVYLAQYSSEPILDDERSAPRHLAEPLPS